MKITKQQIVNMVREELRNMHGNGENYGLPANWARKIEEEAEEMQEAQGEVNPELANEAFVDLGRFLSKLASEGQDALAAELDQILVKLQQSGITTGL